MADHSDKGSYLQLTANIVSAYLSNNTVSSAEIPALISQIYSALMRVSTGAAVGAAAEPPKPVVPIKRSITPAYLICLEDGKKFKSLKRHLRTQYQMTPDQYRAKWNLPADYPMVAPNMRRCVRSLPSKWDWASNGGAAAIQIEARIVAVPYYAHGPFHCGADEALVVANSRR
jgi:predicted transcriptional regulator